MLLVLAATISGCGSTHSRPNQNMSSEDSPTSGIFFNQDIKGRFEHRDSIDRVEEAPLVDHDLRIERSGWIKVDVGEEMAASKRLRKAAKSLDAIVMAFNSRSVTLKMPSKNIETLMATLEAVEGWEIDEFDFSAWDRTGEYFSVSKRMESLTSVRARLLQLVEKAESLDDLLKLEKRLEEVQAQLDKFEGAKRRIELVAGRVDVKIIFDD